MSKLTEIEQEDTLALEKAKRSALDERFLRDIRTKSYSEMAEGTGLTPEDVAERVSRLLEDRGPLNARQEERLLLLDAGDLLADARKRLSDVADEYYASVARVVLGSMNLIADRLDARRKLVESDISTITAGHARIFGDAFDIAQAHLIGGLRAAHPEITDEEVSQLSIEGMMRAKKSLESSVK